MHFLYECGQCNTQENIDTLRWAEKTLALECKSCFHINFFATYLDKASEPIVEWVILDKNKEDANPNAEQPPQDIYWKCGICAKPSVFSTKHMGPQGTKVTCDRCLNFVILQNASEDDADSATTSVINQSYTFEDKTMMVNSQEIIEVLDASKINASLPENDLLSSNYVESRKASHSKAAKTHAVLDVDAVIEKSDSTTTGQKLNLDAMISSSYDMLVEEDKEKTQSAKSTEPPKSPATQEFKLPSKKPPSAREVKMMQEAYANPENSFVSFKNFKEDDTFNYQVNEKKLKKIDPKTLEPKVIKSMEKNMLRYSLLAILVIALAFGAFFFIRERKRKAIELELFENRKIRYEQEQDNSEKKPTFGFPELPSE